MTDPPSHVTPPAPAVPPVDPDQPGPVEAAIARLASTIGLTTGQAYTVLSGLAFALVLAALGLPPVLERL